MYGKDENKLEDIPLCNFGIILKLPIEAIPELERFVTEYCMGRILYRTISSQKLWIMRGDSVPGVMD